VGTDVAVVGFDGIPIAKYVGLTTVQVPLGEIGQRAAEAALRRITGGRRMRRQTISTELVVRRTCGCEGKEKR
jgi:LacI family transcriptional regulator